MCIRHWGTVSVKNNIWFFVTYAGFKIVPQPGNAETSVRENGLVFHLIDEEAYISEVHESLKPWKKTSIGSIYGLFFGVEYRF